MTAARIATFAAVAAFAAVWPGASAAQEVVTVSERPPSTGLGLLITGSILTGVGAVNMALGPPLCSALFPSNSFNASSRTPCIDAELVVGGILAATGIPLLIVGIGKYSRYRAWREEHPVLSGLSFAPVRDGVATTWSLAF